MNIHLKYSWIILLLYSSVFLLKAQEVPQNEDRAIAIILKVKGSGGIISDVSLFNYKLFSGRVKNESGNIHDENAFHIKISDENKTILYDNFFENPLNRILESVDDKGRIARLPDVVSQEYVNVRLNLPGHSGKLHLSFTSGKNENEKIISSFNITLQ